MGGLCGPAPPLCSPACPPVEPLLLRLVGLTPRERKGRWARDVDGESGGHSGPQSECELGCCLVRGVCDGVGFVWEEGGSRGEYLRF